ncbi:hypothetical protein ABPG74_003712 [Tetrahymena malaccensis]
MEIEESSEFDRQIASLLEKEREARLNNKSEELVNIVKQIVKLAWEVKNYDKLFELMTTLSQRRGQSKKAQTDMVQIAMGYIDQVQDVPTRIRLIETIKNICDKKIYLEVEYARCCLKLVKYKESDNEINEAAKILQEVQVETYGSMDKREKIEFILYQMKIMLKKKDYIRLMIISKKLTPQALNDKTIVDLKIQYYAYLVEYYYHESIYLQVSNCFQQIFDAVNEKINKDIELPTVLDFNFDASFQTTFENFVTYLLINKHCHEQVQLLQKLVSSKYKHVLERYPALKNAVESYLLEELISTDPAAYNLQNISCFSRPEKSAQHTSDFRKQLIHHNIRVINKYYSQISLSRLAGLLNISLDEAENELCDMQNDKLVNCKIDRLEGVVNFKLRRSENDILNEWATDVNQILSLIDHTSNLIKREEEQYVEAK